MAQIQVPEKRTRVQDVLKGSTTVGSVEDARKAMVDAGELPKGMRGDKENIQATGNRFTPPAASNNAAPVVGPNSEIVGTFTFVDGRTEEIIVPTLDALKQAANEKALALRQAGQVSRISVSYKIREKVAPAPAPIVEPTPAPAQAAEPVATSAPKGKPERVETKDFTAEIKQEGGKWVGEITYKNGAGSEKFTAQTKADLTLQMLVGKAHATLRLRKIVREQKLGVSLDQSYKIVGVTQEEFNALPEGARNQLVEKAAMQAAIAFRDEHPDYVNTDENWNTIKAFLDKRKLPVTYVNLVYAYENLLDEELLEVKQEEVELPAQTVATQVEDSSAAAPTPTVSTVPAPPAPAPVVRKRGTTTGLQPGFSTASDAQELETTEEQNRPRELSEAELRALPLSEHKKLFRKSLKNPNGHLIQF